MQNDRTALEQGTSHSGTPTAQFFEWLYTSQHLKEIVKAKKFYFSRNYFRQFCLEETPFMHWSGQGGERKGGYTENLN